MVLQVDHTLVPSVPGGQGSPPLGPPGHVHLQAQTRLTPSTLIHSHILQRRHQSPLYILLRDIHIQMPRNHPLHNLPLQPPYLHLLALKRRFRGQIRRMRSMRPKYLPKRTPRLEIPNCTAPETRGDLSPLPEKRASGRGVSLCPTPCHCYQRSQLCKHPEHDIHVCSSSPIPKSGWVNGRAPAVSSARRVRGL